MDNQAPSTWEVFKSVIASFFGVQKEATRQRDFTHGKPGQFIVIGLLITVGFIAVLYLMVKVVLFFAIGK